MDDQRATVCMFLPRLWTGLGTSSGPAAAMTTLDAVIRPRRPPLVLLLTVTVATVAGLLATGSPARAQTQPPAPAGVITPEPKLLTATRDVVWTGAVASFIDSDPGPVRDPRAYVAATYLDLLGRAADPGGLAYWTFVLEQRVPRVSFARSLAFGDEGRRHAIQGLYDTIFGRAPTIHELGYWAGNLGAGLPLDAIRAQLYGSIEYFNDAGATASAYVAALYQDILGRPADSSGAAYFTGLLATGTSRSTVASRFVTSAEGRTRLIVGYWNAFLGRNPAQPEIGAWLLILGSGTPELELVSALAASGEYYSRLPSGYAVTIAWSGGIGSTSASLRSTAGTRINVIASHRFPATGTYTATVTVTPSGQPAFAITSTIAISGPRNERFTREIYGDLLGRGLDPVGLSFFRSYLAAGGNARRRAGAGLVLNSQEYRRRSVAGMYLVYLGRAPTAAESDVGYFTLASGQPYNTVRASVLGSGAYYAAHGSTVNGFLESVYLDVLERPIDDSARATFSGLLAGGTTRTAVARTVLDSTEARRLLVGAVYDVLLDRTPSSGERSLWAAALGGTLSEPAFYATLAASLEYFEQFPRA